MSVMRAGWEYAASLMRVARAARWPVNRGEAYEPFFIVGAPRSGNTLLRRILVACPGVHIPPEMVLRHAVRAYQRYNFLPWEMLVNVTVGELQCFSRFDHWEMDIRPLLLSLRQAPPPHRSLAYLLDELYRHHAQVHGRPCTRWGDKTPLSRFIVDDLLKVFPRARFIYLVRDGVDVVRSILTDLSHAGHDLASAAREWSQAVQIMRDLQRRLPGAVYELRYEKLVTDPLPTSRGVYAFLGLEFNPAYIERTEHTQQMGDIEKVPWHATVQQPIFTDSIGKGRRQFTAQDKRILHEAFAGALEREGYAPATD